MQNLKRRGFDLGPAPTTEPTLQDPLNNWHQGLPVHLPRACHAPLEHHEATIAQTESLVLAVLEGEDTDTVLSAPPYESRLDKQFECMGAAYNEGDEQEVETIMFDAVQNGRTVAEDLWMKISWLSFYDDDVSIRFRFSFGVDLAEDVAADTVRQTAAAELADAVFPESAIITNNEPLLDIVRTVLNDETPHFVERIVYFNAPNGGAYLHHDLERGHAGVVYAQLTGQTCWLALPLTALVDEVCKFTQEQPFPDSLSDEQQNEIHSLCEDKLALSNALNSFHNDALIHLINETSAFVQHLIKGGHHRILRPGDVILLPQQNSEMCCWHSVFCLGDEMGQALSFAIR